MRELKFRVWSEEDKKYRTDCDVFRLFHGNTGCPAIIYNDEGDRFDIEQYTGLKDKNGKEIYEGDIAEALIDGVWTTGSNDALFGKRTWRLEVYWDEMRYAFMWHVLGSKTCPDRVYDLYDRKITEVEVIGNIHDSHKLLGEEEWP